MATATAAALRGSRRSFPKAASLLILTGGATIALVVGAPVWINLHLESGTFYWTPIVLAYVLWVASSFGVTTGYHRLATHESFETSTFVKRTLYACGAMAAQGAVWKWVADHLWHHLHSDREGDPHSPWFGFIGSLWRQILGFLWAHWGWTALYISPAREAYGKKLNQDPDIRWVSKYNTIWIFGPFVLCFLIAGWDGVLWGGFIRLGFTYHVTWAVNSASHRWGRKPYETGDESRNNVVVAILGFGEGNHNNHHAFPWSARHGLEWWELDPTWYLIWTFQKLGLVWNVRVPNEEEKRARKRKQVAFAA